MKREKGFTITELLVVVIFVIGVGSWIWNAVKLSNCDFEPNYRCEVIHGIGLIPALSPITVWFDSDK